MLLIALGLGIVAPSSAGDSRLKVRVSPEPTTLTAGAAWRVVISVRRGGRPVAVAPPRIEVQSGSRHRVTLSKRAGRGVFRARVVFPSAGRWTYSVVVAGRARVRGAVSVAARTLRLKLPYDLEVAPDGAIFVADAMLHRIVRVDRATRRATTHATGIDEPTGLAIDAAGNLYATDFPAGRVLRIDPRGRVTTLARIPRPAEVAVDPAGSRLAVASLADAVYGVDLATGSVTRIIGAVSPHGVEYDAAGNLFFPDGLVIKRLDARSGQVRTLASVEAVKLLAAPDGGLYAVSGDPTGGQVLRIDPDTTTRVVAGNNTLGPYGDGGPATSAGLLPSDVALAPDGALLITQTSPVAAVRRVDLGSGLITTLVRGVRTS